MANGGAGEFEMRSARVAVAAGFAPIEQHVVALERAVNEKSDLTFDLAKTMLESACKAVLASHSIETGPKDDLPKLFGTVLQSVSLLPSDSSHETRVAEGLRKTLNGLRTAVQGICELRNQRGMASHGSGELRPALESTQFMLAAETADAIVGFLMRAHSQTVPYQQVRFEQNPAFNDQLDDEHGPFWIRESEFRPSEVLFRMEPETYRIYLSEFAEDDESPSAVAKEEEP